MSHFASALNQLIDEKKLTQAELSKRSGVPQPQISRWINAEQVRIGWISDSDFEKLSKVFSKPFEQATLMRARLQDICSNPKVPGNKLICINIAGAAAEQEQEHLALQTKLPPKLERDLQTIIEHLPGNHLVRDMVSSLASHLRRT